MSKSILTISLGAGLALSASLAFGLGVEGHSNMNQNTNMEHALGSKNCEGVGTATFNGVPNVEQVNCFVKKHSKSATVTTAVNRYFWNYDGPTRIYSKFVSGDVHATVYGHVVKCNGGTWKINSTKTQATCKYRG